MKKKILLDLERLRYPYSGIANVFHNLSQNLRAEMQRNVMRKSAEYNIENVGLKWIKAIESALAK